MAETDFKREKVIERLQAIAPDVTPELAELVCDDAIDWFKNYTKLKTEMRYEGIIGRIAVVMYNRWGSEGIKAESFSGIREDFTEGMPKELMRELNQIRKV